MSGEGGIGGVGGSGAGSFGGGGVSGAGGASRAVSPPTGVGGTSDDGGKETLEVAGDNNFIGNTQTQTINQTNNYFDMSSNDFCVLQSGRGGITEASNAGESNMNLEEMMKMIIMMMIMKMLQEMMEAMGEGQGGQGGGMMGSEASAGAMMGGS